DEMVNCVERVLRDIGLTKNFAPLVFLLGHGSGSLNNPHESAYCCGACSGGWGGANARSYAQMANDPLVRERLARRGVVIPESTYFLGAIHNTCDEDITYFDLDRLPFSHRPLFESCRDIIDQARERNAHERCRRFESADADLTPSAALAHVEERAEDLSQARPEYNHATNALCFVGRRAWSRGLYLDRRAFLQSYDPAQDTPDHDILARILLPAVPVCAGISLEYYFSTVDHNGYGCGSKLPHNITSLLGVMEGAASDLRTGLSQQMVEIHEPLRILFLVESTPQALLSIMERNAEINRMVRNRWVQLGTFDAATNLIQIFNDGRFEPYVSAPTSLPVVKSSIDWYRGWRDHLGCASIVADAPTSGGAYAGQELDRLRQLSTSANEEGSR
ncbi:MAG: putative inorganic carbon transporter subunit DabA, partial [Planctomycetaceae bacterium]